MMKRMVKLGRRCESLEGDEQRDKNSGDQGISPEPLTPAKKAGLFHAYQVKQIASEATRDKSASDLQVRRRKEIADCRFRIADNLTILDLRVTRFGAYQLRTADFGLRIV
jgi:type II secretory ATPase GspE/PulE/Tfp pilus assembly ATPase PilB-like protein